MARRRPSRGGKSRIAALCAVFMACFRDYRSALAPGEVATIPVIAADRKQARTILRYVNGLLDGEPLLARIREYQAERDAMATIASDLGDPHPDRRKITGGLNLRDYLAARLDFLLPELHVARSQRRPLTDLEEESLHWLFNDNHGKEAA